MAHPVVAPRYMTRFACIGSACEDTCCAGWAVTLDAERFKQLRGAMNQTKADRETFAKTVLPIKRSNDKKKFALIVLDSRTGGCSFLDEEKLCGLQKRFAERVLPDVCATYPRRQSLVGERVETALVLSCPEAARKALLAKDAMELVDVDSKLIARESWIQVCRGTDGYERSLDMVRLAILDILSGKSTLAARLATVAALAQVLGPGFAKGKAIDSARAATAFETFSDPQLPVRMAKQLAEIEMPLDVPMLGLLQLLSLRSSLPEGRFGELMKNAASAYAIGDNAVVSEVAKAYAVRRDGISPLVAARLDEIITNYAMNYTFTNWFTSAPSLGVWVRGLILRTTWIRFLVLAHPDLAKLSENATPSDETSSVERVAVEVVSRMSRAIEHHGPFLEMLDKVLPAAMPGLEHALCMLKV